jgi:hypothetical protein
MTLLSIGGMKLPTMSTRSGASQPVELRRVTVTTSLTGARGVEGCRYLVEQTTI